MARLAVVVKPVSARAADAVRAVASAARDAGLGDPLILETTVEEPGGPQARYAVAQGVARIVVAGGDGTVREVAGALLPGPAAVAGDQAPARRTPLGVVPVGTGNLFARSARLPVGDVVAAARQAVAGRTRATDLGRAVLTSRVRLDGPGEGAAGGRRPEHAGEDTESISEHVFLVVTGMGYDAATLATVRLTDKGRLGWLAYFVRGVRLLGSEGHALQVWLEDDRVDTGPLWSVLAVNAARLPAGASVAPGARLDDGVLHTVLVSPRTVWDWGRIALTGWGLISPTDHPALRYRSGRHLEVSAPGPVPAQVDGDVVPGVVRARVTVLPGALDVAR